MEWDAAEEIHPTPSVPDCRPNKSGTLRTAQVTQKALAVLVPYVRPRSQYCAAKIPLKPSGSNGGGSPSPKSGFRSTASSYPHNVYIYSIHVGSGLSRSPWCCHYFQVSFERLTWISSLLICNLCGSADCPSFSSICGHERLAAEIACQHKKLHLKSKSRHGCNHGLITSVLLDAVF